MPLEDLVSSILDCRLCEADLPLGANPVLRVSPSARILIAAQAPGIRVHQTGIPFNDPSGDRLRNWMGIDRDCFYDSSRVAIVPMGFCYPGSAERGDLPPRPECAKKWRAPLLEALGEIEFTLVIGQYAHRYHLGKSRKSSLSETVRCWHEFMPSALPLPHPSPRNNIWLKRNPWFEREVLPVLKNRIAELLGN